MPLQPDPVVQPSTHRGNPHCGDERSEGDPYGRVLPGTLASPLPNVISGSAGSAAPVLSSSDQLVAVLGQAGVTISRSIADRILGVGGPTNTSVQVGGVNEVMGGAGMTGVVGAGNASVAMTQGASSGLASSQPEGASKPFPLSLGGGLREGVVKGVVGAQVPPVTVPLYSADVTKAQVGAGVAQGELFTSHAGEVSQGAMGSLAGGGRSIFGLGGAPIGSQVAMGASSGILSNVSSAMMSGDRSSQVATSGTSQSTVRLLVLVRRVLLRPRSRVTLCRVCLCHRVHGGRRVRLRLLRV